MRLADRVAIITGATSGIGRATALLFAREGARLALTGRNDQRGREVVAEIRAAGGCASYLHSDVCREADCRAAIEHTISEYGRLDILFNNAGVFFSNTAVDCSEQEWDAQVDTSLKGAFLMSKFALPHMIRQGRGNIIHNSSGWGIVGGDRAVAYCAAKGGLVLMAKAMAIDHGRQGIRVNCVCPGDVDTPMLPEDARHRGMEWNRYLEGCANRPLGRIGTVDEIAKTVLFLASDESSFITGAAIAVDGGGSAD
ncbi:MAG TPA: SDR family NAD(P)-dependent oxidoreductase [Candidatus Acidoferrales bacterium]|nr:SDR family NAD(P)-dependent oxidoreductase [Candidatus Acidoferrales bacterium]